MRVFLVVCYLVYVCCFLVSLPIIVSVVAFSEIFAIGIVSSVSLSRTTPLIEQTCDKELEKAMCVGLS